ncbi:MAG: hypothetical protein MJZ33_01860 [Paludibacteraceae bacterium]|nr:hypothetical protein [Paludibacteraceae bacterium]
MVDTECHGHCVYRGRLTYRFSTTSATNANSFHIAPIVNECRIFSSFPSATVAESFSPSLIGNGSRKAPPSRQPLPERTTVATVG